MIGVAEYMYTNASKYNLNGEKMYVLGLLHDIGYISGSKNGHEEYGAELLKNCFPGSESNLLEIIKIHDITPQEYMRINNCKKENIPKELLLLLEADMMVDLSGEAVGFNKRLEAIKNHYGEDSNPYRICHETIEWLKENSC
jgi:HD superfamily phosphodiesterase